MCSAASESSAIAGAQKNPSAVAATTIATERPTAWRGSVRHSSTTAAAPSPSRIGTSRPERSDIRPAIGLIADSAAAATRKVAPTPAPLAPRWSSRSGTSTARQPKPSAGSATSHMPVSTDGRRSAAAASPTPCATGLCVKGIVHAQAASTPATITTDPNTGSGAVRTATAPTTGPNSEPAIPAPSAVPITAPRRSGGASATSQASAPAHEQAPPMPCTKRAASSNAMWSAKPKARLEPASSASPSRTVTFGPSRDASTPPGSEPTSVPTG